MVKHTQAIRWLLPTNCLSIFDHFVRSALKGLKSMLKLAEKLWELLYMTYKNNSKNVFVGMLSPEQRT